MCSFLNFSSLFCFGRLLVYVVLPIDLMHIFYSVNVICNVFIVAQ